MKCDLYDFSIHFISFQMKCKSKISFLCLYSELWGSHRSVDFLENKWFVTYISVVLNA